MSTKRLPSLSRQLTLWYSTAFCGFIVISFALLYWTIGSILDYRLDEDLLEDLEELKLLYEKNGMPRLQEEIDREAETSAVDEFFIQLLDGSGATLYHTPLQHWRELAVDNIVVDDVRANEEAKLLSVELEQQEAATRVLYGQITPDLILFIGESTAERDEIMAVLNIVIVILIILVVPAATLVGWLVARRSAREISAVSRVATQVDHRHLDMQVNVEASSEEVHKLVTTFNSMLKRIHNLIVEMRHLTDNVAHDMRSPLARIRALAEINLSQSQNDKTDGTATTGDTNNSNAIRTIEECDRLLQLVNTNLDISELESGTAKMDWQPIDISNLVLDACELFDAVAEQKHIVFDYNTSSDCRVLGNMQMLQRMLANIIDNAIKYSNDGGAVSVNVDCGSPKVKITIQDNGIGIPDSDKAHIFERFYRGDQSRTKTGCGLGLSFARAVARAHKGNITVADASPSGSIFTVVLPKY